ncbi:hypothetical protein GCM10009007_05720 [Formosimonas limnophila]|uniref:Uncharacterized protein n=1 Tax=Formosimonas limnophila TaxID=1384487 RepID=A0A8J3FYS0_9BURK|nr:hypothetical protein [Formosimonas limnophila]GHA68005.1 hypothetical protein GCM10009007_05720 [Formosimonas limnophila]
MQGCIISKLDKNTRERGGNSVITITTRDETNILLPNKVTVSGNILTIETQYEYDITSEQLIKTFLSELKGFSTENWDKKMKSFHAKVSVESILKFDTTIKKPLHFKQTSKIISAEPKMLWDAPIPSQVKEITYGEWKESFF